MKTLIANRGAIACRIIRTLDRLGFASVAVFSEADIASRHVEMAGQAIELGAAPPRESYLNIQKILAAAKETGAEAIHPGYGFLSENADFARACEDAGIRFIGPTPSQMEDFGLKHRARELAGECNVPLLPGTQLLSSVDEAVQRASGIGYPVMLKSTAGGGGIGMRVCNNEADLREHFDSVTRLSQTNFKNGGLFLEKFVRHARHIEVQIFGDGQGRVLALGERDCSLQRRNQKVVEETPAPNLPPEVREQLFACARRLGERVKYRSAGTVEFVYDAEAGAFYFLEVNTRLQVEHGVTEEVLGIDLVEWMVRLAAGDLGFWPKEPLLPRGHSVQVRVYAEDPLRNFQPSTGMLTEVRWPADTRIETWVVPGNNVTPFYDPLVAKLIVHRETRAAALQAMRTALDDTAISGIETNRDYLRAIMDQADFVAGHPTTSLLGQFKFVSAAIEVVEPGAISTVQDYPGRMGYWAVGVPPSGPMDDCSFRLANRIVGNPEAVAALELTMVGPVLRFHGPAKICLTGARVEALLNGRSVPMEECVEVPTGAVLKVGRCSGGGCRTYLAFAGGLRVPDYLGSKSTFTLGKFGGPTGRALQTGDMLHLADSATDSPSTAIINPPRWGEHWNVRVLYGPHGAPDFFTNEDIEVFFSTRWKVHYNSNPTGIRLIGPKPRWARSDGGEAGLHPSNIHDNAYAVGTVDFTGDMPIILGLDGPSLGGFVCPATIIRADRWMMGQFKPGDTVRFVPVTLAAAEAAEAELTHCIDNLRYPSPGAETVGKVIATHLPSPVLRHLPPRKKQVEVKYRQSGDKYLLIEYGQPILDLDLRFRVHALMNWLLEKKLPGVIDLTPGIRSLQIHYNNLMLPAKKLLDLLEHAEEELADLEHLDVPSRIIHLPLSWDDPATRLAIEKYTQSVRADAPWCPSNIEFIRRINGLSNTEEVRRIVFDASYLVLGLGDVYLGAPVATPLDPRHRLVTTKYNPARTWTPENAVGIGGAYLCIYGMEGPGGYQFVGRTIQVWNTWRQTRDFTDGKPWLLRFFDQIRFYPVSAEELLRLREDFPLGRFKLKVEETTFSYRKYHEFLHKEADDIAAFRKSQREAFGQERERWKAQGQEIVASEPVDEVPAILGEELPGGCEAVRAPLTGNVWKVLVKPGQVIERGQPVVIVEAMKMEAKIDSPCAGRIREIKCVEGRQVSAGQLLVIVELQSE
ncbi:urea carboxylase [Pedosphaera parvula]|uniref:Urea carboxylase n=1 Tax=Pedosphaera parvula (strain Ellin514) TaxID=320771 RepID=B9XA72_PEDPL|nr:urea carboxylase [Pedosphaera parvula]EEF63413.1 urea carboxylase [Pedosphaera parvula Ellin514]